MIICSYCYIREKVKKSEMKYSDMAHSKLFTSGDILTAISKEYKCTSENCYHFQPERSKREDLGHKYCYKLIDGSYPTADEMHRGYLFSKEEADLWKDHGGNRAWHEQRICYIFPKMRCSEHCGNTVRDK